MKVSFSRIILAVFVTFLLAAVPDALAVKKETASPSSTVTTPDFAFPKKVIKDADKSLALALKKSDGPATVRALVNLTLANSLITVDSLPVAINRIKTVVATEKDPATKAMLNLMLARIYQEAYMANSDIYNNRRIPAEPLGTDWTEWSGQQYRNVIDQYCTHALSNPDVLKATTLEKFSDVLDANRQSFIYFPTLFDFISSKIIDIKKSLIIGSRNILSANFLVPAENFIGMNFENVSNSQMRDILSLYANLLETSSGRYAPYLYQDAQRIRFIAQSVYPNLSQVAGEKAFALMLSLFERYAPVTEYASDLLVGDNNSYLTNELSDADNYEACSTMLKRYPQYWRSDCLRMRMATLTRPSIEIELPAACAPGTRLKIRVSAANARNATLKIFKLPKSQTKPYRDDIRNPLLQQCVATIPLQFHGTAPFKSDTTVYARLDDFGAYVAIVEGPGLASRKGYHNLIRVTSLGIVTSADETSGTLYSFNPTNGQPVADVTLTTYSTRGNTPTPTIIGKTDSHGYFSDKNLKSGSYYPSKGNDILGLDCYYWEDYRSPNQRLGGNAYSDLPLYHPGDSVQWVNIVYSYGPSGRSLIKDTEIRAVLHNANGLPVDTLYRHTDRSGRIAGAFLLPKGELTGQYFITFSKRDDSSGFSTLYFMVSDYKLPTFFVKLNKVATDSPQKGYATISGSIRTYSGAALTGSTVNLQLAASEISWWRSGSNFDFYSADTSSGADGTFSFVVPKNVLDNSPVPLGRYTATVSATSPSGESHESTITFTRDSAYYIFASLADDYYNAVDISQPVRFTLDVKSADGSAVSDYPLTLKIESTDSMVMTTALTLANPTMDFACLPSGKYNLTFSGDHAEPYTIHDVVMFRPTDSKSPVEETLWVARPTSYNLKRGESARIPYAIKGDNQYLLAIVAAEGKIVSRKWEKKNAGMHSLDFTIPDGATTATLTLFTSRDFKPTEVTLTFNLKSPEDELKIEVESFRDRLVPGQEETWTFRMSDGNNRSREAFVIADMYNDALSALRDVNYTIGFNKYHAPAIRFNTPYVNRFTLYGNYAAGTSKLNCPSLINPDFNTYGYGGFYTNHRFRRYMQNVMVRGTATSALAVEEVMNDEAEAPMMMMKRSSDFSANKATAGASDTLYDSVEAAEEGEMSTDAGTIPNATGKGTAPFAYREGEATLAMFRPTLSTDGDGRLTLRFTVPDANARWRFQAVAYNDILAGASVDRLATANKPLMVQPNLPRFVRQGDKVMLPTLTINNSETEVAVTTSIELFNPATGIVTATRDTTYTIAAGANATAFIVADVPAEASFIGYRVKSSTGRFADGEQQLIPVLPSISPVVETMPFYIAPDSMTFEMSIPAPGSDARVTLQYCDNPTWYVVTALPGLRSGKLSTPADAADAIFSAAVAEGLLRDNPDIARALKEWTTSDRSDSTLTSMLNRNSDLKTLLLKATPWMVDAMTDTERMQRLALLFDKNEIAATYASANDLLRRLRRPGGGWAWISQNDHPSQWATDHALYIFGRLNRLNYMPDIAGLNTMISEALSWSQSETEKEYRKYPKASYFSYLSLRSQWPQFKPSLTGQAIIGAEIQKIVKDWKGYSVAMKAETAPLLFNNGYKSLSRQVLASLREYAVTSPEKGEFWPSLSDMFAGERLQLQIAADALLAFNEIEPGSADIDRIRQWLILQKEAQNWGEGSMTSLICTAILSTSRNWITPAGSVSITVGDTPVDTPYANATIGNLRTDISRLCENGARLSISRTKPSPAWGAIYSRSLRPITSVKASGCDAVSIEKRIFKQNGTDWVDAASLKVGDRVKVQLLIHASRDMQYMALTDDRAACFEPVEQIPAPILSEGICFYRENLDTSTNIFVTNMPKGTYLLEYELWVNNAGTFASGIATIQSQYAPQLSAHSSGETLKVSY